MRPRRNSAFTLIEMLLSLALAGMLMTALSYTLFNFSQAWFTQQEDDAIYTHAHGVAGFLQESIYDSFDYTENTQDTTIIRQESQARIVQDGSNRTSAESVNSQDGIDLESVRGRGRTRRNQEANNSTESSSLMSLENVGVESPNNNPGENNTDRSSGSIKSEINIITTLTWNKPPGYSRLDEPLISFKLPSIPPFIQFDDQKLAHHTCYLYYDQREGLYLLWHSEMEEVEDLYDVHNRLLSKYVTQIEYAYFDKEQDDWELLREPRRISATELEMPDYLRLTFEHEGELMIRDIHLPSTRQDVPVY